MVWVLVRVIRIQYCTSYSFLVVLHTLPYKEHFTCILIRPSYWHEQKPIPMGDSYANPLGHAGAAWYFLKTKTLWKQM